MPKSKLEELNLGGTKAYKHLDGKINFIPHTEEEKMQDLLEQRRIPSTVSGSPSSEDPELLKQIGETGTPEEKSLIERRLKTLGRQTAASIGADVVESLFPPAKVGGPLLKRAFNEVLKRGAGFATSAAASEGIGALQGENVGSLGEAGFDRALSLGTEKALGGLIGGGKRVVKAGQATYNTSDWGELVPHPIQGVKDKLTEFIANRGKLNTAEQEQFLSGMSYGRKYGAPTPATMGMGPNNPFMDFVGRNARVRNENAQLESQKRLLKDIIPNTPVREGIAEGVSTDAWSAKIKRDSLNRKRVRENQASAAHQKAEALQNEITVPVQTGMTQGTPVDFFGNSTPPQPIIENVKIKGPVDVTETNKWAGGLRDQLEGLQKTGNLNEQSKLVVNEILGMVDGLQNTATLNGRQLASHETVKALRSSLGWLSRNYPDVATDKKKVVGTARSLMSYISKDIESSMADPSLWKPEARLAQIEANNLTRRNAGSYGSNLASRLEGIPNRGDAIYGKQDDVDVEAKILKALGSSSELRALRRFAGPEFDESISSQFIKIGMDRAMEKNGLYNADKLEEYFVKDLQKKSVLESGVMSGEQRRNLKEFINYVKRNSDTGPSGSMLYKYSKAAAGLLSLGIPVGSYAVGGSSTIPIASAVGGTMGASMYMGKEFFERVLLDPEGGKLIQQLIHAPTTQQQMSVRERLVKFGLANGIKTTFRYMTPEGEKTKTVN